MVDVVIVGGGVIGLTTAYFLAREGVKVAVLDKGDFGQESSWAGAGILPPASVGAAGNAYEHFRDRSARMFPLLSQELRELTGVDNGYLRSGGLEFINDENSESEWHSDTLGLQVLQEAAVRKLEPGIAGIELGKALYLSDMAQVRNPRHMKALLAACCSLGVELRPGELVCDFVREGSKIRAARVLSESISASRFLVAGGAWTDGLLERFGVKLGIVPIRGQIAMLSLPAPAFRRILLAGTQYLVPRPDGRVLVGSTEENVGFDKRTTVAAIEELLGLAMTLVPPLRDASLERCWAGLRPGSPDGLPFLGTVPGCDNLYVAAGHFRSGIFLSPATGVVMKELILGQAVSVSLEAFRLDRMAKVLAGQVE